jgi:hypothetical protein
LWGDDGDEIKFSYHDGITYSVIIPFSPDTNWHHIVGVWDADENMHLYLDGKEEGTPIPTGNPDITSDKTTIGTQYVSGATSRNFDGQIDEVKIFNYALTSEQVRIEYNNGAVRFQ